MTCSKSSSTNPTSPRSRHWRYHTSSHGQSCHTARCYAIKHHLPTLIPCCPHSSSPHRPLGHHTPTKTSSTPRQHMNSITQSPLASANHPNPRKRFLPPSPVPSHPPPNPNSETFVIAYANMDGFSLLKWLFLLALADKHDIDVFLVVESHFGPGVLLPPTSNSQAGWLTLHQRSHKVHSTTGSSMRVSYSYIDSPTVALRQHHSTDNQTVIKSMWKQPLGLRAVYSSPNSTGDSTDNLYEFIRTQHSSLCPSLLLEDLNAHTSNLDVSHDPFHTLPPRL